jgi:mono/diheme cytochrome c family protein
MSKNRNKHRHNPQPAQGGAPVPGRVFAATSPAGFAALREGPEPTAGNATVPVLMIALLGLLVYLADVNLNNRGGEFDPKVYYPFPNIAAVGDAHPRSPDDEYLRKGRIVYGNVCLPCHQVTGLGQAGVFPPLAGSEWVLAEGPNRMIRIVLHGLSGPIQVGGAQFNNAMPPWKDALKDEDIGAVLSFVRNSFGNKASIVRPDEVKKIRAQEKDRDVPETADELLKIPVKD